MTSMTERLTKLRARRTSADSARRYTTPALWRQTHSLDTTQDPSAKALLETIAMQAKTAEASVSSARKAGASDADAEMLARRYLCELAEGLSQRAAVIAS
ncbi:hypothetical protein GCM10007387_57620 [Pseudoduganella albidiflava]|uniref:Uncharacterized protein n=1 Tax=Pseudoduganella albidiflava TaxID=321983 RepID=A0AA87Y2B7_9BURK|nr:hypothetical protein GCM10007387_57620 [Pseudoduganella albidiflava]